MEKFAFGLLLVCCLLGCSPGSKPAGDIPTTVPATLIAAKISAPAAPTGTPILTPTNTPTPTVIPTETAVPTETTTPTETATPTPLPPRAYLQPMNHQWQTLNNCHRASIAALMAYYDVWIRQDEFDVGMDDLPNFVSPYGLTARVYAIRYALVTMDDVVRWYLTEDIPIIVGQKLSLDDSTWHYRVIYAYDDQAQQFTSADPLLGPSHPITYDTFARLSIGSGQVIPVYPVEMDETIQSTMKAWQMKLVQYP